MQTTYTVLAVGVIVVFVILTLVSIGSDSGAPYPTSSFVLKPAFVLIEVKEDVKETVSEATAKVVHSESVEKVIEAIVGSHEGWRKGRATVFWVGEGANETNDFIHNEASAWDEEWEQHFGGLDDPDCRIGFHPCGFVPKENAFYVALPYNDLDDTGKRKSTATHVPWNDPNAAKSVLKNRWVEVRVNGRSCYGQWQDVGPNHEDDWDYVFGNALRPLNTFGVRAGIDLSPAMRDCLAVGDVSDVEWRHVEKTEVPSGPWKEVVTSRE